MQGVLGAQPLPYSGMPQLVQPIYPGFNGPSKQTSYNRKAAMGLGITQMLIGITCVILNSVLIAFNRYFISFIGYGIWGGILIFVAGLLQVLSAKKAENRCLIIGTLVMTIIASCASAVILGFSIEGAVNGDNTRKYGYYYSYNYRYYNYFDYEIATLHFGIGIVMVILAVVEALIAITTSALSCGAVCCKSSSMRPIPVYIVGNLPVSFQSNYPGMVLPPGQTPISGEQSSSQIYHYPQDSVNPGLSSIPPPTYDNTFIPGTK